MKLARAFFNSGVAVVLVSAFTLPQARAAVTCQAIFQADANTQSNIDKSIKDLVLLRLKLDEAKASGQSSVATSALEGDYLKKEREIFEFLITNKIMSREELIVRIRREIVAVQDNNSKKKIEEEQRKEEQKREIEEAPFKFAKKMNFHGIRPGKFKMGEAQVETEITKPFEMMSTQVTQMMWARLKVAMGEKDLKKINPSSFKSGTDSITVSIDGIAVEMKPDHPVEWVNYGEAQEFIDGLNKLSNSSDIETQRFLKRIIPDHKQGDHYDLPTEAQWEFVMRDRGNANKEHFDRDDVVDISNYAWSKENAGSRTHAVATLKPRMIDGKPFYDLEGNVWEWNKDWYNETLKGGKDPQGPAWGELRVLRGGCWNDDARWVFGIRDRGSSSPDAQFLIAGLRLVRTSGVTLDPLPSGDRAADPIESPMNLKSRVRNLLKTMWSQ